MALFLGIDGGGTGCRAAVADGSGRVIGTAVGGPANIASDPDGAAQNILAVTRAALGEAVGPGNIAEHLPHLTAAFGLAGANIPDYVTRLAARLPFKTRIETDAMTAVKGALKDADGVVAALGTGSVFAVQRAGNVRHIGGWGFVLGDEGSGAWLGRALLARALRAADGFVPMTPLLQEITNEMGGRNGIVAFGFAARPADFAAFAPRITTANDPAALDLLAMAEAEIGAALALLQGDAPVPVVFLGGLGETFAPRFAHWDIRAPLGTGLDGALWLARQGGAA